MINKLNREASIVLASLDKDSKEYKYTKSLFDVTKEMLAVIDGDVGLNKEDINFIINTLSTIVNKGVLSPLTLKDDEFEDAANSANIRVNKRYNHIQLHVDTGKINNVNAFCICPKAAYDHLDNKEVEFDKNLIFHQNHVYISKGGFITGEYINDCYIREDIVRKGCFSIQSVVNLPISIIHDVNTTLFVVDHREPKLKALKEFYDVPTYFNKPIADRKYDIRKYTKLK